MLEVQQETPLGAYAVEYITAVEQPQRSCYEMNVQISYRRSAGAGADHCKRYQPQRSA